MTALVLADLHLSENPRDAYRNEFMKRLPAIAKKYDVDQVIILGDLTEDKDRHGAWLVNQMVEHIYALTEFCYVIIDRGNHDYVDIDEPYFRFLDRLEKVTFIISPVLWRVGGLGECLFLPHTRDYKKDWTDSLRTKKYSYIFAHNTFAGADVGHGRQVDGVPLNVFRKDARVISGDVHVPQQLGPVTYVGSPYLIDFGDDFKPRMLLINETKVTSLRCVGPQKRLVDVDSIAQLKTVSVAEGDIVKVRIKLPAGQLAQWPEMQEKVRLWGRDRRVVVHAVLPVVEAGSSAKMGHVKSASPKSDKQVVTSFAHARDVDDRTLNRGLDLMDGSKK